MTVRTRTRTRQRRRRHVRRNPDLRKSLPLLAVGGLVAGAAWMFRDRLCGVFSGGRDTPAPALPPAGDR